MVVLILLLTASRRALDRPDRMVRRMSKRRRSIFSPSLENSSMPERDASADRAHALPVDAHQRRHGAPGRVHAQPCGLPLEVTRVRALASRHGTIATVHPVLRAIDPPGRVLQQEPGAADVEMPPAAHAQPVVRPATLPTSGAPVHVPRVRAHRDDDDVPSARVLLDARHAGHDVRGQARHALERAG